MGGDVLYLKQVVVRLVRRNQDQRFQSLMHRHHYLGALPKIGETLRYAACIGDQWVGLVSFSAPALKCAARDQWIGWPFNHQFDRLNLLTNNSRFLILPDWHLPNMASRILGLVPKKTARRLASRFRTSRAVARNLRRSRALQGNHL